MACYLAKDVDEIIYTHVANQHEDSLRFLHDCEKLLGRKIHILQSDKYDSVDDVIERTRCINIAYSAPCTKWLKKHNVINLSRYSAHFTVKTHGNMWFAGVVLLQQILK